MVGIGDKLLLLFIAFRNRLHRPLGEQNNQNQHQAGAGQQDKACNNGGLHQHGPVGAAIHKDHAGAKVIGKDLVAVIGQPSPDILPRHHFLGIGHGLLLGDGIDGIGMHLQHLSGGCEEHRKMPGGIGSLRRDHIKPVIVAPHPSPRL